MFISIESILVQHETPSFLKVEVLLTDCLICLKQDLWLDLQSTVTRWQHKELEGVEVQLDWLLKLLLLGC